MRYRLQCPRCGDPTDHAFVRLGAVAQCEACGKVWRIEAVHVQRLPAHAGKPGQTSPTEPDPDGNQDLIQGVGQEPAPRRQRDPNDSVPGLDDTSMVGLSGLSEVMRDSGGTGEGDPSAEPPTPGLAAGSRPNPNPSRDAPGKNHAQRRAAEAARRRRSRTVLMLLSALTVMVGSLGVAVALLAARGDAFSPAGLLGGPSATPTPDRTDATDPPPQNPMPPPPPTPSGPKDDAPKEPEATLTTKPSDRPTLRTTPPAPPVVESTPTASEHAAAADNDTSTQAPSEPEVQSGLPSPADPNDSADFNDLAEPPAPETSDGPRP